MVSTSFFGAVLEWLAKWLSFARIGWNGDHKITLQVPDENSKMTQPYIYITTENWDIVPWVASQTDILADDWYPVS